MRDNRDGVAIGAGRPPALVALRMDLSPRPENTSLVTQRGPRNQRAASCNPPRTKSTDGPHWGGGDRPSPCFGAPPALGRGLRHPATRAFAVHHPCCRHLGPTPKGGRVKSMPGMEGTRLARRGWAKRKAREQQASTGCARSTGQSLTWRQQLVPVDHPDPRWPAAARESRERPVDGGLRRQRRGAK